MPLVPTKLANALIRLDDETVSSAADAARRWFEAYAEYAMWMTHLIPPTPAGVSAATSAGRAPFLAVMVPALTASKTWASFTSALESSLRAFWLVAGAPPHLLPAYTVSLPAPSPLGPFLAPVEAFGKQSSSKRPPRIMLATQLDLWTRLNLVVPVSGTPPTLPYV